MLRAGTIKQNLMEEAACALATSDREERSGEGVSPCGQRNQLEQGEGRINRIHPQVSAEVGFSSFPKARHLS